MSGNSNKENAKSENANLPNVVFGALLQTGAGMALIGSAAIAAPGTPSTATPYYTSPAPQLVLQPDGSVAPAAQESTPQRSGQPAGGQHLVVAEDGSVCLQGEDAEVSDSAVVIAVTGEKVAELGGAIELCEYIS